MHRPACRSRTVLPLIIVLILGCRTGAAGAAGSAARGARVVPARWDFAQLSDWHRYLDGHVLGIPGVQTSDIDEVENRIRYSVLSEEARRQVLDRLGALDVPRGLVSVHLEARIELLSPPAPDSGVPPPADEALAADERSRAGTPPRERLRVAAKERHFVHGGPVARS